MILNHSSKGFTLVEMAVVLVIVGFLTSALLVPITAQRGVKDITDTRQALDIIKEALYGFAVINGRLPCPTTQADPNNSTYGVEDCSPASVGAEGYLPWKTLGVSEGDAWVVHRTSTADSWTGYWRYRVDVNFAATSTFSTNILLSSPTFLTGLTIKDALGNSQTTTTERPIAIVYSLGKNLVADGQNFSPPIDTVYQSNEITTTFDDQLVWITRPILVSRLAIAGKLP